VNPISALPQSLLSLIPASALKVLQSESFLPNAIGPSFMVGLLDSLYIAVVLSVFAAVFSALRGKRYVHEEHYAPGAKKAETANGGSEHDQP
jgi:hypothetical protein